MITLTREEAQSVLDALNGGGWTVKDYAVELLRFRLSEPEPAPVAWMDSDGFPWSKKGMECRTTEDTYRPLYAAPVKTEPNAEPEAWISKDRCIVEFSIMSEEYMRNKGFEPLYTAPPQREWQPLTEEEIDKALWDNESDYLPDIIRVAEAKLREKNT